MPDNSESDKLKKELTKMKKEHTQLQEAFEMMQEYLHSVKNIEVVEKEQTLMREKLHKRKLEYEQIERGLAQRQKELEAERESLRAQVKQEIGASFDHYQSKFSRG